MQDPQLSRISNFIRSVKWPSTSLRTCCENLCCENLLPSPLKHGTAITLAEYVTNEEHRKLAKKTLAELPEEELKALRQVAVSHVTHEYDSQECESQECESDETGNWHDQEDQ